MTEPNTEATRAEANNEPKEQRTAGQRLAAQKAAKAARKAAAKGRPVVEEAVLKKASRLGHWMAERRKAIGLIASLGVLAMALGAATFWYFSGKTAAAADLLQQAIDVESAPFGGDTQGAGLDSAKEHFASIEERNKKAVERYGQVISRYPNTQAADWARLAKAKHLLNDSGKASEARKLYREVLVGGSDNNVLLAQAFEGVLYSYESAKNYNDAIQEIKSARGRYPKVLEPIGRFHEARFLVALGQKDKGGAQLAELVKSLRKAQEDEQQGGGSEYLLAQAELLLLEVKPEALPGGELSSATRSGAGAGLGGLGGMGGLGGLGGAGGMGGPGGDMSPEQIQKLIEQLQKQQGAAPEPPPPSGAE